jgi:hypothetical protein
MRRRQSRLPDHNHFVSKKQKTKNHNHSCALDPHATQLLAPSWACPLSAAGCSHAYVTPAIVYHFSWARNSPGPPWDFSWHTTSGDMSQAFFISRRPPGPGNMGQNYFQRTSKQTWDDVVLRVLLPSAPKSEATKYIRCGDLAENLTNKIWLICCSKNIIGFIFELCF